MKYLKTFELLNKSTADYDKVYTMNIHVDKDKVCKLIGKLIHRDYGTEIVGYVDDREIRRLINGRAKDWNRIREANPEELDHYIMMKNIKNYNI